MHGTADRVAKLSGSREFHEQAGSIDKTLKLYEGRFHDPLNELGKEAVMSDILEWIERRLPRTEKLAASEKSASGRP